MSWLFCSTCLKKSVFSINGGTRGYGSVNSLTKLHISWSTMTSIKGFIFCLAVTCVSMVFTPTVKVRAVSYRLLMVALFGSPWQTAWQSDPLTSCQSGTSSWTNVQCDCLRCQIPASLAYPGKWEIAFKNLLFISRFAKVHYFCEIFYFYNLGNFPKCRHTNWRQKTHTSV